MKKIILTVILITMFAVSVFGQSGTIREITGDVELKHAGASEFVAASAGASVNQNTIISTGFRSTAVIAIGSATITVRPLTRLSLAEIQSAENSEDINVNLQAGRVRVEVRPPAGTRSNLTVQSTSASASVRGTVFDMDTHSVEGTEGKVIASGTAGPGGIITGVNTISINMDGTVSNPADSAVQSAQIPPPEGTPPPEMVSQPADVTTGDLSIIAIY